MHHCQPTSTRLCLTLGALALTLAACSHSDGTPASAGASTPPPKALGLTVFAGAPSGQGYADGTRLEARFSYVMGMRFDQAGNMFVADMRNHVIRKIAPDGKVTTFAGTPGLAGGADGAASEARFNSPTDVAVDSAGNVYVADSANSAIRKISPAGVVSTFAGAAAGFSGPNGIVIDKAGNLYVADTYTPAIRRITPAGVVSTLAGSAGAWGHADGAGAQAQFSGPGSIAIDGAGTLYVTDGDNTIRRITPAGVVSTVAGVSGQGGSKDGAAGEALFSGPSGISADGAGNLYVMDGYNSTLRKITPAGVVSTVAGTAGKVGNVDGPGATALLKGPGRVTMDGAGNVYISDNFSAIRKLAPDGTVSTWAGVAGEAGTADGAGTAARFNFPNGIAIDAAKTLYVADQDNGTLRKVSASGQVSTFAGTPGNWGHADGTGAAARFGGPGGVALDAAGNVYVTEWGNHVVRKITPAGVVSTLAGAPGESGYADGAGAKARFNGPNNLALDKAGNVYVADYGNHSIRKITPDGVVSTFAGGTTSGSADGAGTSARFNGPNSIAIDAGGNLLVTDSLNNCIRRISPAGVVTTLAGQAGVAGSSDGSGSAARFNYPWGIAIDSTGNVFVADSGNNSVRRIDPAGMVSTVIGGGTQYQNRQGALPGGIAYPIGVAIDPATGALYITFQDGVLKAVVK
ncbi:MAG: SMP-30/gluconolactonase/LRE family protein [Gammaproteobacteria bacterium]